MLALSECCMAIAIWRAVELVGTVAFIEPQSYQKESRTGRPQ